MYLLTDTREESTPSERRSRSWLSKNDIFFTSITSKTSTSALIIGVFALGILSNQKSSFSHETMPGLCRDPAWLETSMVVLASPSVWILYSRVTNWHALLFTNYQIFPPENRPTKNLLLLRLDALLIPILADRPGMSVDLCFSLLLWLCSGCHYYAMEL